MLLFSVHVRSGFHIQKIGSALVTIAVVSIIVSPLSTCCLLKIIENKFLVQYVYGHKIFIRSSNGADKMINIRENSCFTVKFDNGSQQL